MKSRLKDSSGYPYKMLALAAELPPIVRDDTGTLRVRTTRITRDDVVHAFDCGASAEEVVEQLPTLDLSNSGMNKTASPPQLDADIQAVREVAL